MAEKPRCDPANRGQKIGLVWQIERKSAKLINDNLYLLFSLSIISGWNLTVAFIHTGCSVAQLVVRWLAIGRPGFESRFSPTEPRAVKIWKWASANV